MSGQKRQTIAFISLYTQMGGVEYTLFHLLKNIDRNKYRPLLIVNDDGPLVEKIRSLGIEVFFIKFRTVMLKELVRTEICMHNLSASLALRKLFKEYDVSILSCTDVLSLILLFPSLISGFPRVVYSVTVFYERSRLILFNILAAIFVHKIVYNSRMTREHTEHGTAGLRRKGIVIYNGVDKEDFYPRSSGEKISLRKRLSLPADKIIIGFIGRYDLWKGHRTFLEAAKLLLKKRNDLQFLIVGGSITGDVIPAAERYRTSVLELASAFGFGENLIIWDHRNDIPDIMACLDVFVCPSEREPYGLVILEAYASGIPVVASITIGALEIFPADTRIFIAEPDDPGSFGSMIEEAIFCKEKEKPFRHEDISPLTNVTWQVYTKKVEDLFK